jgi:hypothetical protein
MARFVRKQSLWSRIKSYPFDLLLELNEQRELIDWDSYSDTIALPLGFTLTTLYFFIRLSQDHGTVKQERSSYFDYQDEVFRNSKYFSAQPETSLLQRCISFLQLVIIMTNVINTLLFMFKTKTYAIFNKDTIHHTSSARKVSRSGTTTWSFLPWIKQQDDSGDVESYWELNMWNPSKFSTYLFVSFPPFNIAFLYMAQSSFTNLIFLNLTSIVLYFVIIRGYLVLIQDKQVLYQETFDEYERKYVRPKLSVAKREVAVDATRGPYDHDAIQYYSPGRTEKLFKTHDLRGRETIEVFTDGEFTPVKKTPVLRKSLFTPATRTMRMGYQQSPLSRKTIH